jgi:hypothetical protein
MASLYPYIAANARAGQKLELKLHEFLWRSVGQGSILILNPFEVDLTGHLSVIVYSGDRRFWATASGSLTIAGDPLLVNFPSHAADDPTCCPSLERIRTFRLREACLVGETTE